MAVAYLPGLLGPGMRYHPPNLPLGKSEQHMRQRKHLPGHLDARQPDGAHIIIDDLELSVFQCGLLCWPVVSLPFSYFG